VAAKTHEFDQRRGDRQLRILLVDDNNARIGRLLEGMTKRAVATRDEFVVCTSADEARDRLVQSTFDLLLLDIVLPRRAGDDPIEASSVELLTELVETESLKKPRHVVGITAFSDAMESVSRVFFDYTWTLIHADEMSDEWLDRIERCIVYIRGELNQPAQRQYDVDLLVLTALREPEMEAVHRLPWNWQAETPLDDTTFYRRGEFESDGRRCSVVTAVSPRMGMVPAALLATKMFEAFRPRICVMPGICAGVKGRAAIGDVLFSDLSWDYQSGKHYVDDKNVPGFLVEPYPVNVDPGMTASFEQLGLDEAFWNSTWRQWVSRPPNPPRLLVGPVASGSAVLADSAVTKKIVEQQRKVRGVEMELYGVYLAAQYFPNPRPIVVGIKSVCDFADESKNDDFQKYASYVSAATLQAFFDRNMRRIVR
jgi:nucleoside phosphorylase/CheY-like chemotaxis protein